MQFTTLIATAILAMGTNAAVVQRGNPNLIQFTGWRESKCSGNASAGEYILLESDINTCKQLAPPAAGLGSVRSVDVHVFNAPGCTLTLYYGNGCGGATEIVEAESCVTVDEGFDYFNSYKITC
ncbi:hypothetical protein M434DRAFT_36319 [Hypoxylon sp. CO27-5]|nr:hypothetical protein M434DRAFT_36319 [Hypoxylon sp. CO27-5]